MKEVSAQCQFRARFRAVGATACLAWVQSAEAAFKGTGPHPGAAEGLSHSADEEDRNVGKSLLRDYINATLGFQTLAKELGKRPESLMRMLSVSGNPRLSSFAELIDYLFDHEGIPLLDEE